MFAKAYDRIHRARPRRRASDRDAAFAAEEIEQWKNRPPELGRQKLD
jgi:hypothetical protein